MNRLTLSAALISETTRRARAAESLSDPSNLRSTAHVIGTLDTIAACSGRMTALSSLLDVPADERRERAVRLLCRATTTPAQGSTATALAAEVEVYTDAISGRFDLTHTPAAS